MNRSIVAAANRAGSFFKSTAGKVGTGLATLGASSMALATTGTSPGAAIAGELSGGKAEVGLVIAACAVILGFLLLWAYSRKAAK